MGRFRIGLGCVLPLIAFASTAAAGDYRSGFGFGITVPDVYLVLTAEEVARKADLFLSEDAEASYGGIPSGLRDYEFVIQHVRLFCEFRPNTSAGILDYTDSRTYI